MKAGNEFLKKTKYVMFFWCEAEPHNSRLSIEKCERISVDRQHSGACARTSTGPKRKLHPKA